jgi:hypothetical protein
VSTGELGHSRQAVTGIFPFSILGQGEGGEGGSKLTRIAHRRIYHG